MPGRIVLHGHFYQPPREGPWLDLVPWEPSAAPDHDWNTRITRECYAPLTAARVLDARGAIRRVINTFEWCSFNVGPTLFRWLDRYAPEVARLMVAGDRAAVARTGLGTALAMPWHHLILPLASRADKVTEVRWGVRDFRNRFGREPLGMWLPETATDEETLDVLAQEGIRFTVLAPHQVDQPPADGSPVRWLAGGGKELILVPFNGPASHAVAFSDILRDADHWAASLLEAAGDDAVVTIATDGETYGHHHRFGDLALAALIDRLEEHHEALLVSLEELVSDPGELPAARLLGPSSWSCEHGVERWRSDCTCGLTPGAAHGWRAPLREGLEALAEGLSRVIKQDWPGNAGELSSVLEAAGPRHDPAVAATIPSEALPLIEVNRHRLAMFTSCGWFFDDIGRIEPMIILRHAARALDLIPEADRLPLEAALVERLAETRSSDPDKGSGEEIWERDVIGGRGAVATLAAGLAALHALMPDPPVAYQPAAWDWEVKDGLLQMRHRASGQQRCWQASLTIDGVVAWHVRLTDQINGRQIDVPATGFTTPVLETLRQVALPMILDASLDADHRALLAGGLLDPEAALDAAWRGAWLLVEEDGLEQADILVHGVIDAWMLHRLPCPDHLRSNAFQRLQALPPSWSRQQLALRLGLTLP